MGGECELEYWVTIFRGGVWWSFGEELVLIYLIFELFWCFFVWWFGVKRIGYWVILDLTF